MASDGRLGGVASQIQQRLPEQRLVAGDLFEFPGGRDLDVRHGVAHLGNHVADQRTDGDVFIRKFERSRKFQEFRRPRVPGRASVCSKMRCEFLA